MYIVIAIVLGSLFGAALYYVGAANPEKIVSMLRLENLELMKIILFAIGFASVHLSVFGLLGIINTAHISIKTLNLGVVIGGLIFGIGFGSIGTCPGTCAAALGAGGFRKAFSAVLGGLTGAFIFSLSYGFFKRIGLFDTMNFGKISLFNISGNYDSLIKIGFWGLLITGIIFMLIAKFIPDHGIDYTDSNSGQNEDTAIKPFKNNSDKARHQFEITEFNDQK